MRPTHRRGPLRAAPTEPRKTRRHDPADNRRLLDLRRNSMIACPVSVAPARSYRWLIPRGVRNRDLRRCAATALVVPGRLLPECSSSLTFSARVSTPSSMSPDSPLVVETSRSAKTPSTTPGGCPAIRSPGSIGHNRICMTTMAGPSTPKVPDRPTTLFSNADLCRILEASFPVPLRGGSPSSTKLSAAIVHRSGSAR